MVTLLFALVSPDRAGFSYLASVINASAAFAATRAAGSETAATRRQYGLWLTRFARYRTTWSL
jgi:hypothetical protein